MRYDFTVPYNDTPVYAFHNSLPFLHDTVIKEPHNAFLRPFIADPPTTTLQRLKGLTTGTLPTFIDAGENFAGSALEEDNLLMQLRDAGKKIVHLGDDTWTDLFPGYFEEGISRAWHSLTTWDLHTVDNGVIEHIFPLLRLPETKKQWDVMFAHLLGVDHAGHRYGPNHPAMTAKLKQMDVMLRDVVETLDDETLLVVMGDHGMDQKGDHGGESDDEVEAALWMYSRKGIFGRTDPAFDAPPATAKERPVNQIDLVPTLALLLGLPIPFNNLGAPIEEAFSGAKKNMWENLAKVSRITAAGIKRYQAAYYLKRGVEESTRIGSSQSLWEKADKGLISSGARSKMAKETYEDFSNFQVEALRILREQWSRFNVPSMLLGIGLMAAGLVALLVYANARADDDYRVQNEELEKVETQLELEDFKKGVILAEETGYKKVLIAAAGGAAAGSITGIVIGYLSGQETFRDSAIGGAAIGSLAGFLLLQSLLQFSNNLPRSFWAWLAVIFTVSQSVGFASNSFTIWEDSMLLYFLSTLGFIAAISSMRLEQIADRTLAVYHSLMFVGLGWVASFSKLCRDEQMPYCSSTYYASSTSSTAAPWQLIICLILTVFLPAIIKSFYASSRSYEGFAPAWIGWVMRFGLILNALFWILDTADDDDWFSSVPEGKLKDIRIPIAFTVFGLSLVAGPLAYRLATPCVSITSVNVPSSSPSSPTQSKPTILILGYGNVHGTLYMLLPVSLLLSLLLVQKPMGQSALSLMLWQTLSLLEILDLNSLTIRNSPLGPLALALLSSFHFFKTGHQYALSTIQWHTAYIPFYNIVYPWSPLLIVWNTFGATILGTALLPAVVLWKREVKDRKGRESMLRSLGRQYARYLAYWVTVALATMCWAGWLRRHLMLYRIFCPRFLGAVAGLLVVDVVGLVVVMGGVRRSAVGVGRVFGWG